MVNRARLAQELYRSEIVEHHAYTEKEKDYVFDLAADGRYDEAVEALKLWSDRQQYFKVLLEKITKGKELAKKE